MDRLGNGRGPTRGYPITQSRRFFFGFTHSRNERKIWVFTRYRKNWVENWSFHEITQEKCSFHEFTLKFYAFHASRMEGISCIHAFTHIFFRFHARKKGQSRITQTHGGGASWYRFVAESLIFPYHTIPLNVVGTSLSS